MEFLNSAFTEFMIVLLPGYIITLLSAVIAYLLSREKPLKRKYIVWGSLLMVPISPAIAFSVGRTYAMITQNIWAAAIMLYIFPIIFIIGLIMLLIGVLKKKEHISNSVDE